MRVEALTKVCTKCGAEKGLSEFGKDRTMRDGRATQCKVCKEQARIARDMRAAKEIGRIDGCLNEKECRSKSYRLCPSCSWTKISNTTEGKRRIMQMVADREADDRHKEERRKRLSKWMRHLHSLPEFAQAHSERSKKKAIELNANEEFMERRRINYELYNQMRRADEEFDAFMERMEAEAAEYEAANKDE